MWAVLIVDDEYGLAEMTAELLAMRGHKVATAINGRLALASIDQLRPDVILVDVMMPIMPGDEMVRRLKRDPALRDIPVIMMSAAGSEELDSDLLPVIAGFLQKPFTFDELMRELHRVLPSGAAR
ncbi:MAG TPA: response regulator [Kofleriaceae bacterium]|nr:response regulator [Kofleriaceae bacterium]